MTPYRSLPDFTLHARAPKALARLHRGFSLIELMVGIAIIGMLLTYMIPSMAAWMQSTQLRSAAESIQGAVQLARVEAVRRNTSVQLVLTSVAGGGTASDWTVGCVTATADCPAVVQQRPAGEGSPNAVVTVTPAQSSFVFNSMGRLTPPPAADFQIDVTHIKANSCILAGGDYRCQRLFLGSGGQVRMCDPSLTAPNPRAC